MQALCHCAVAVLAICALLLLCGKNNAMKQILHGYVVTQVHREQVTRDVLC